MTAGRSGADLGRMDTGPWLAACTDVACGWQSGARAYRSKARQIAEARHHAKRRRHVVELSATVDQHVFPPALQPGSPTDDR
jgi:hypothetical protein